MPMAPRREGQRRGHRVISRVASGSPEIRHLSLEPHVPRLFAMYDVEATPITIERLPVPFFRQLRDQGRSPDELDMVARTFDLARQVFGTRIDFDGGPAISHFIGTASACAAVAMSTPYVCFALIHNIYRSGAFPDGEQYGASATRRAYVRQWVDTDVEAMAYRRYEATGAGETFSATPPKPGTHDALTELVDVCDIYEKYEYGRIHAANPDRGDRRQLEADPDTVVARARLFVDDDFAGAFALAITRPADIPEAARSGMTYGAPMTPNSAITRPSITIRRARGHLLERGSRAARWTGRKGRGAVRRARGLFS